MAVMMRRAFFLVGAVLALGACRSASPPQAPAASASNITSPGFKLPEGAGCSGEIARTRAVIDNDLSTGNVDKSVHDRFVADLGKASAACAAGRDGEALRLAEATKARFGYR